MTINNFDAILFDLDGVLWNSLDAHEQAFDAIFDKFKIPRIPYPAITGKTTSSVFQSLVTKGVIDDNPEFLALLASEKQAIARSKLYEIEISNEAKNLLRKLKSHFKLALVSGTSAKSGEIFLEKLGDDIFDVTIFGDSCFQAKPSPEPYLAAAKMLAIDPHRCMVVEDSEAGVESCLRAKMTLIHINSNVVCEISPQHRCFGNSDQFMQIILAECCL
jgi:beta-phosphoglucomutase